MHSKALEKIEKKVEGTLKNCQVKDSWPQYDSFAAHFEPLAAEILKHTKEWLTKSDVFLIFYDLVCEALREKGKLHEELNGGLWDLLGEVPAQKLKKTLVEFYDSIPRNYDVYIPIPNISIELESVAFNDVFALVVFDKAEDIPGGYNNLLGFNNNFKLRKAYFRYSINGYCSYDLENFTLKKALSYFKIAFQQGLAKDIFKTTKEKSAGLIARAVQEL